MSRQKISLNNLSGPDSRDLSGRYPADRIRVSAWFCQNLSEVPACYLGITRGRVRPFYLPVLPLYGFTKLYTNPFLLIYYLPSFKLPVLVLVWGIERKKLNSGSHSTHGRYPWVKLGAYRGLGHQVLALMLIVASTPFLLLNAVKLSRPKKVTEYLPLKRVEGSSASTVIGSNFHQKFFFWEK
jgi:hypothetical protein